MATPSGLVTAHTGTDLVRPSDGHTPTTPRPPVSASQPRDDDASNDESGRKTPTRHSFASLAGQQRLPDEPVTPARQTDRADHPAPIPDTKDSQPSPASQKSEEAADVEMGDADDLQGAEDDGSDNDSVTSDSQRPLKKKKGQRFFCTDFPPCQLSFTRSEHLARHIRKHTGERPFQCHCNRRFSRMDNLRQHAQTVHCNEDIPGDSLAATSTRFQRQIRTDRVRAPGNRSRTNTMSSAGGHSRGHSRNVSTSSMGSTTSSVGAPEESRKRPLPLAMANDPAARAHLSLDTFGANAGQYPYYNQSPTGYSTPTSTTFSAGTGSPRFGSGMASPASTISRSSFYNGARRGRRLSVPSAQIPLQTAIGGTFPPPYFGAPMHTPNMGPFNPSSSVFASPTASVYSHSRRESESELDYRRRTWHPGTWPAYAQRPVTSGLSYHQTPDDHRPAASDQRAASQVTRLPGIESFDQAARQQPSPMVDAASPRPISSGRHLEAALPQSMGRLDIAAANAPVEGQWQVAHPQVAGGPQAYYAPPPQQHVVGPAPRPIQQQQRPPGPEPISPRRAKRQGWYGGPVQAQSGPPPPSSQHPVPNAYPQTAYPAHRPSPEDSGSSDGVPTPSGAQGSEYHPAIVNPIGLPEPAYAPHGPVVPDEPQQHPRYKRHQPPHPPTAPPQTYALQAGHDPRLAGPPRGSAYPAASGPSNPHDMGRLEALVAVATSENRASDRA